MSEETQLSLDQIVLNAFAKLILIEENIAEQKPSPDKWSAKEIVGHLVDSACNNHGRFMRAQFQDEMVFDGYNQEGWVTSQNYQESNWQDLLILWRQLNLHIAHLTKHIPVGELVKVRTRHNFHQIAWKTVPQHEETTLAYFIDDYVGHLQHHLKQVFDLAQISA